jgi:hypothetical protein
MRKRGEIASHVFVYILGILTVGLLMLVGIKAVDSLQNNQCDVRETQFVTQLASAIEKNKGWGVSRVAEFQLPCEVEEVCFVDRVYVDAVNSNPTPRTVVTEEQILAGYGAIVASVESGVKVNVFMRMADGTFNPVPRFEVAAPIAAVPSQPITCIGGEPVRIRFNGQGTGVQVTAADPA